MQWVFSVREGFVGIFHDALAMGGVERERLVFGGTEGAKIAGRRKRRGLLLSCGFRCF